jgi:hypothetical protein
LIALARFCLWGLVLALMPLALRAPKRRMLRKLVGKAEYYLEAIVTLMAVQRVAPPLRARTTKRPASTPLGFRLAAHRTACMRAFTHKLGLRLRGKTLQRRLEHVRDVLASPDAYIARLVTRLERGLRGPGLIAAAPPAIVLAACADAFAPSHTDSS